MIYAISTVDPIAFGNEEEKHSHALISSVDIPLYLKTRELDSATSTNF